jgi:large subunit ribosomal protein L21
LVVYAIIEDGSHQFKVEEGQIFEVQRRDLDDGQSTVDFDKVLLVGGDGEAKIGQPYLAGAKVTASVINPDLKGEKIVIQKFKRRKGYARKTGHRQHYLRVKVDSISA